MRVFSRRGVDKDERALSIERSEIERLAKDRDDEKAILERSFYGRLKELLANQVAVKGPKGLEEGTRITEKVLSDFTPGQWRQMVINADKRMTQIEAVNKSFDEAVSALEARFENKVDKLQRGDELPPGVMKLTKVFVAVKRKLQPGDKMAGRHGNKGVISRIMPTEDMPYLEDGTPIDIVLNPLGVPSRMNVGQILETHLGWASNGLGRQIGDMLDSLNGSGKLDDMRKKLRDVYGKEIYDNDIANMSVDEVVELAGNLRNGVPLATPVFDGATEVEINQHLEAAGPRCVGSSTVG